LYIAIGILGATVMPHNLYLHSRLVQTRGYARNPQGRQMAIRFATIDSTLALMLAFLVNGAILILSAATFHGSTHQDVADIRDAHRLLSPMLGAPLASVVFAVALLASGQNSTITGTMAGQIVMEGFLHIRLRPWLRRLVTRAVALVPALTVAIMYGEDAIGDLLILSQVILSAQLAFAVVPLVQFTSSERLMGRFVNSRILTLAAWSSAAAIIILNSYLLWRVVFQ
ncbi:MAG: divalent metal cation transporter, partial [Proteobacteria bacterium]|nr:divalent metal cation transporter [Pseudomonadota bacterium]